MESLLIIPIFFGLFVAYLLPAIVANARGHRDKNAVFMLNLLFGWTLIGWGAAFIWSLTGNVESGVVENRAS